MHSILFVCYANVCRSPIAEFVMKQVVRQAGVSDQFRIESAGTDADEGADIWFKSKETMDRHGVPWVSRCARQLTSGEYGEWDLVLVMDYQNLRDAKAILNGDPEGKVRLLNGRDAIADPYFHGDFDKSYEEIRSGCLALLKELS